MGDRDRYVDVAHHRAGRGREPYTHGQAFAGSTQQRRLSSILRVPRRRRYRRVAWKHNSWHAVAWMQLDLLDTGGPDRLGRFADPRPAS
jgi:hypothetical protein